MSSGLGYPDWQKIQQWLGAPLDQASAAPIGAGAINLGPYNLASWASIVVALKPTGGKVTVTVKQKINGGPASLELDEVFIVNAGTTTFEAVVLFGDVVSLTLQGDTVGETVDYAIYPSNTTTNAQVITNATINVQHNDALVAAEQTVDFVDSLGFAWSVTDDAPNTRVKVAAPPSLEHGLTTVAPIVVQNTVAEVTIANVVIPAGVIAATGLAELDLIGLFQNATGAAQNLPRFRVYINGVLKIDTGQIGVGGGVVSSGVFFPYKFHLDMIGLSNVTQALGLFMKGSSGGSITLGGSSVVGNGAWSSVGQGWEAEVLDPNIGQNGLAAITVTVTVINALASANYLTSVSGGVAKHVSV